MKKSIRSQITMLILFFLITVFSNFSFAQQESVQLAWTPNTETNLSHYVLYRDTSPGTMVPLETCPKFDSTFTDNMVENGQTYYYKLTAVDSSGNESSPSNEVETTVGVVKIGEDVSNVVKEFELKQNYPNPFNPTTTIDYSISTRSQVTLIIYNVLGTEVRTLESGFKEPGSYSVVWDGKDKFGKQVSSGVYFYQMKAENFADIKKLVLQK